MQIRTVVVFQVVNRTNKVRDLISRPQNCQGIGANAVLGMVAVIGLIGVAQEVYKFLNSLFDQVVDSPKNRLGWN